MLNKVWPRDQQLGIYRNLLEMQNLGPHPRPSNAAFQQDPQVIAMLIQF